MTTPVDPHVRPLQAPNPPGWEPKVRPAAVRPKIWRRSDRYVLVVLVLAAAVLSVALWNPWRFVVLSDVVVVASMSVGLLMLALLARRLLLGSLSRGLRNAVGPAPVAAHVLALLGGFAMAASVALGSLGVVVLLIEHLTLIDPPDAVFEREGSDLVVEVRQSGCYMSGEGDSGGAVYLVARRGIASRRVELGELGWCEDAEVTFVGGRDELILTTGCRVERIAYDPHTLEIEEHAPPTPDPELCSPGLPSS